MCSAAASAAAARQRAGPARVGDMWRHVVGGAAGMQQTCAQCAWATRTAYARQGDAWEAPESRQPGCPQTLNLSRPPHARPQSRLHLKSKPLARCMPRARHTPILRMRLNEARRFCSYKRTLTLGGTSRESSTESPSSLAAVSKLGSSSDSVPPAPAAAPAPDPPPAAATAAAVDCVPPLPAGPAAG